MVTACARVETLSRRIMFAVEGDSLSTDIGGGSYPEQLVALLGEGEIVSFAVGGSTLQYDLPTREAQLDQAFDVEALNVLLLWPGSNDLKQFETPPEVLYALYLDYVSRRVARGWKVIAFTILPRWSPTTPASFEPNRQAFNALLRASGLTLVDVAADPRIGDAGDNLDTTYYTDGVHQNAAGKLIVAELAAPVIENL